MIKFGEPEPDRAMPTAPQEQGTIEVRPGRYNIRAIFPEDAAGQEARVYEAIVVILGSDDQEVKIQLKDPVTRKTFSVGDVVVRYDLDGEPSTILLESLSFLNNDVPFSSLIENN